MPLCSEDGPAYIDWLAVITIWLIWFTVGVHICLAVNGWLVGIGQHLCYRITLPIRHDQTAWVYIFRLFVGFSDDH